MELHIEGQHIEVSDDLRTMIADRLEKLNARHGDIIHARVSLVKSNHHQHGAMSAPHPLNDTPQSSASGKDGQDYRGGGPQRF